MGKQQGLHEYNYWALGEGDLTHSPLGTNKWAGVVDTVIHHANLVSIKMELLYYRLRDIHTNVTRP